jgi:hypothetical protein
MPSRHLSLRLDTDILDSLDAESGRTGQTRSQVAKTLLDEGLRMRAHPGIVFRDGPAGRRPGLVGGPDVWEVARVLRGIDAEGGEALRLAAELTGLAGTQVRAALRYYAAYTDEIDAWLTRVDEEAERAEEDWEREQRLLRA